MEPLVFVEPVAVFVEHLPEGESVPDTVTALVTRHDGGREVLLRVPTAGETWRTRDDLITHVATVARGVGVDILRADAIRTIKRGGRDG